VDQYVLIVHMDEDKIC